MLGFIRIVLLNFSGATDVRTIHVLLCPVHSHAPSRSMPTLMYNILLKCGAASNQRTNQLQTMDQWMISLLTSKFIDADDSGIQSG